MYFIPMFPCRCASCLAAQNPYNGSEEICIKDYGPYPFVIDIDKATLQNNTYRTALWTGEHLQLTLMSINPGEDIGLEIHPDIDQFFRIEQGSGFVEMGKHPQNLNFKKHISEDTGIVVPAGYWHNITNTGNVPLKLYSIYAPPKHPFGTVHRTKEDAESGNESL